MKRKITTFAICIFLIVLILFFIIKVLKIGNSESILPAKDLDFGLNFIYHYAYGEGHVPNLNTLSVGNWSTMYLNNQYGPIYKLDSTHILMSRASGYSRA